jgi:hypothetical protein
MPTMKITYSYGGDTVKRKGKGYSDPKIISDPLGSYTGRPIDIFEVPVQDADDL